MTESLSIALLQPCFWPEVRRGAERHVREFADELIKRGHRPHLITSHPHRHTHTWEEGLEITRNRRPPDAWLTQRSVIDHATHLPATALTLSQRRYDIVHAFFPTDGWLAARWSAWTRRPAVYSHLGVPDRPGLTGRLLRLQTTRSAAQGCGGVTALSRSAADAYQRWLGIVAEIVYPGVDVTRFTPGGSRSTTPTIFFAAAAEDPRKRIELLVGAVGRLRVRRPNARLVVMRPPKPELAARLSVTDGVDVIEADPELLQAQFRHAWASVLPSRGEAGAMVVLESLACGTPAVGADDAVVPELLTEPAHGRLFAVDDEQALCDALDEALDLVADPATAVSCRARAEQFSTVRTADGYLRIYERLLEQEPAIA